MSLDIIGDVDEQGDWTDRIVIRFSEEVTVTVIVPPPPDDWTLDSWKIGSGIRRPGSPVVIMPDDTHRPVEG